MLSPDGTNRLTLACVSALTDMLRENVRSPEPLVVTGNDNYFSAGADLREIRRLDGVAARDFSRRGQQWWAIVKIMYFGRLYYTEPVEVTIA